MRQLARGLGMPSRGKKKQPKEKGKSLWFEDKPILDLLFSFISGLIVAVSHDYRWYLLGALIFAIIPVRRVAKSLGRRHGATLEIFIFFFVPLCSATYGFYQWLEPINRTPNFLVRIYPFGSAMGSPYTFPLTMYHVDVHNQNQNSVSVHDFSIEFHFKNVVESVNHQVVRGPVGGLAIYSKNPDGSPYRHYEESNPELKKKYSFQIQQEPTDRKQNLNFVDLYVERWVDGAIFSADIVIDLTKEPLLLKSPDDFNSYTGEYVYEIMGDKFSGKIKGTIPEAEDTRKIKK